MNEQIGRQVKVLFFLIIVLAMSACGTFEIEPEPAVSGAEMTVSTPEASLEDTLPAGEETIAVTEEMIPTPTELPAEADDVLESLPSSAAPSEVTELDETWLNYTNHELGFSINFPKEIAAFRGSCYWNEEQGSYRPETALVPVKIFEDTDAVYIAAEHFYELAGERTDGGRSLFDECNPITNTLQLLRDPDYWNEPNWKLVVKEVRDDNELDGFLKERYGPGCGLGEQLSSLQDGVYDVTIEGDGKGLEETQCPLNFVTVVKYFPAADKVIAWNRGQSNYFPANVNYSVTYDQEMEDSFRFLNGTSVETAESVGHDSIGLQTYTNEDYGFSFNYPSTWTVTEVNDEDFVGPGSRSVQLSQGTVRLVVAYRRSGENVAMGGSGAPAGEFEIRGTARILGTDVERYVLVFEGKDKVVYYGQPGSPPLSVGGLEFSPRMDDFNPDYATVALSQTIQDDADLILSSLALSESESGISDEAVESNAAGWQTYTNDAVGYSVMIPADAQIMSLDPSERVAFVGPEVDGKPRFQFMILHYDINSSASSDFRQQLAEGHRGFLETMGIDGEGMTEEVTIAGIPAIRLRFPTINGSEPKDDYHFFHDGKMFQISITHFGGSEDWTLYDRFLQSITFSS